MADDLAIAAAEDIRIALGPLSHSIRVYTNGTGSVIVANDEWGFAILPHSIEDGQAVQRAKASYPYLLRLIKEHHG